MEEKKYLDIIGLGIFKSLIDKRYPILDPSQKIPQSYLPSYVDDVVEYTNKASFPTTGESGKIYVDTTTNLTYRWGGSSYVEISPSLALGETSSTAFRGDLGKTAYEHSQATHKITIVGLGISTLNGSITAAQMKTPLGITALEGYFTNGIAKEAAKVSNALTINGTAYDGSSAVTITTPNDDTKNTAGSTQDANKLFIIGAKTQAANPQTYSNSACYISGNELYSNSKAVLTSITKAMVESVLTGNITSHTHTFASLTSKPTTIAGYGITDAKIANGVITLGANTITPLTAHQTIYKLTIQKNGTQVGTFTPNSADKTINISDVASADALSNHTKDTVAHLTSDEHTHLTKLLDALDVDASGDVFVVGGKGFYTSGFITAGRKGTSGGEGSSYTQKEWADIKIMTAAPTETGILASAYSVKEAYEDVKASVTANSRNISDLAGRVSTLEGKATAVSFKQTIASGVEIGTITIDNTSTKIYSPSLAALMGASAIGGESAYPYWNGSAWATKALGSNAFTSISKVSQLTNDSGYITGITKAMVEGVLTGNITSHTHSYLPLSGGTMANTNVVTNLNADLLDGYHASSFSKAVRISLAIGQVLRIDMSLYTRGLLINAQSINTGRNALYFVAGYGNGTTIRNDIRVIKGGPYDLYFNGTSEKGCVYIVGTSTTGYSIDEIYINPFDANDIVYSIVSSVPSDAVLVSSSNSNILATLNSNVASSSKWATPRTITLTGSVTGSVSIDGSGNVSLATTTNHTHDYLPLTGGTLTGGPGVFTPLVIKNTNISEVWIQFQDSKGGAHIGTSHGVPSIYLGSGSNQTLIHSGNYNSYAPKLDGTGATGTWGINIQGFAFSAYALKRLVLPTSGTSDGPSLIYTGGQYTIGTGEGNAYEGVSTDYNLWSYPKNATAVSSTAANIQTLRLSWDKTKYWHDIFLSPNNSALWHRSVSNGSTTDWYRIVEERTNTTWGINISGNAATATNADTLDGVHFQNILERETSGFARGTDVGWYRIAETYQNNSDSYCFLLGIQRSYGNTNNETYLFSICISYRGRISITQLSGSANVRLIDKIRIDWGRNAYYIDLYINTATDGNTYRWYTVGAAKSYTAWTANPTLNGTAYEFTTVNGCKSDLGFTGDLTGNAATADTLAKTFAENINYAAYTTGLKLICYDNNWDANGFPEKWTSGLSVMAGYCGWQLVTYGGSSDTPYFRKVSDSGVWSNWRALAFTDSNVASATNADMLDGYHESSFTKKLYLGTTDLNSISNSLLGQQDQIANATPESHYPIQEAGGLISILSVYNSTNQIYGTFSSNRWFARGAGGDLSSRTPWREFAFLDSNVASATKLANSRTLWGQSFDGTGNVSGEMSDVETINFVGNWMRIGLVRNSSNVVQNLIIQANGGLPLSINPDGGNVGIGTTSPQYKLDVNGSARITVAITAQHLAAQFIELVSATPFIDFHYNSSTADFTSRIIEGLSGQLTVTGKLRVGLGYTTSTDYALHIVGTTYSSAGLITDGAISAAQTSTSSDIKLKDNISEIGSKTALQWLLMLKPKSWTWNDKAGVTGQSMGFVAQDVEGILPQMVKKQDNGYLSLDYTQLHALEVSALQSHEKRIEELERENKILKAEINRLKQYAN